MGEARNPKLEAAIAAAPDDEKAYLVYADWLEEQGDPRGELILLHQRGLIADATALIAKHAVRLLGPLAEHQPEIEWKLGFPRRLTLHDIPAGSPVLETLQKLPFPGLLRQLFVRGGEIDKLPAALGGLTSLEQLEFHNCRVGGIDPTAFLAGGEKRCEVRFQYCEMNLDALFDRMLVEGAGRWRVTVYEAETESYAQTPRFKEVQAIGDDFLGDRSARSQLYQLSWGSLEESALPEVAGPAQLRFLDVSRKPLREKALQYLERALPDPLANGLVPSARFLVLGKPVYQTREELLARLEAKGYGVARSAKQATHALVLDSPGAKLAEAVAAKLPLVLEAKLKAFLEAAGPPLEPHSAPASTDLEERLLARDPAEVKRALAELRARPVPPPLLPALVAAMCFADDAEVRKEAKSALLARAAPEVIRFFQGSTASPHQITDGAKLWRLTRDLKAGIGLDPILFSRHMTRLFSYRNEGWRSDEVLSVSLRFPENEKHVFGYFSDFTELFLPDLHGAFPSGLGVLQALERLRVEGGRVTSDAHVADLATLPRFTKLEYWVKDAALVYLSAIKDRVTELGFRGSVSGLSHIDELAAWSKLASLDISYTGVTDLSPLFGKKTLAFLNVQGAPVESAHLERLQKELPALRIAR